MFKYSSDDLIKSKEKRKELTTINLINKKIPVKRSRKIEDLFHKHCGSFVYLEDFVRIVRDNYKFRIAVVCIGVGEFEYVINNEIKNAAKLLKLKLKKIDYIPYIKFNFDKSSKIDGGNVFLLFLNNKNIFDHNEEKVIHYLNKFNKFKLFL